MERRSACPIAFALDIFGDKWSLLIIRDLSIAGRRHFAEFENAGERIATNILTQRLKHLCARGIVQKNRDPNNGRKRIYTLSPKGLDLLPLLLEMILWSAKYDGESVVSDSFVKKARAQPEKIIADWGLRAVDGF